MSTQQHPAQDPRQQNPYADLTSAAPAPSPAYAAQYNPAVPIGIWARGQTMIFHKAAVFPDICLKSGKPAAGSRFKQKLSWHPPWIIVMIFVALLIYIILAAIFTKTAHIDVALLPEFKKRRRMHLAIGTTALLACVAAFIGGIVWMGNTEPNPEPLAFVLFFGSIVAFIGSMIYLAIMPRMFKIEKITDNYVYLKGIHPDVMKQLPPCPFAYDM
ncbi:MAG TPA: hypothetical protein VGN57_20580 [Pirellulaceae bacterium]|nr:hypothetical protein [Pirellulaceae bacterium]